jgi:hypothetical protein
MPILTKSLKRSALSGGKVTEAEKLAKKQKEE